MLYRVRALSFWLVVFSLVAVPGILPIDSQRQAIASSPNLQRGAGGPVAPVIVDARGLANSLEASGAKTKAVPVGHAGGETAYRSLKEQARETQVVPSGMASARQMDGAPATPAPFAPSLEASFPAIGDTGWFPPDAALAVGSDEVLVAANSSFVVRDKGGTILVGPVTFNSFYSSLGLPLVTVYFDPRAAYDAASSRWFLVVAASDDSTQQSWLVVSVSTSTQASGTWYSYALDATLDGSSPSAHWADYPALGLDSQALYLTANMFPWTSGAVYTKLRILDKGRLISGSKTDWYDLWNFDNADGSAALTLQPAITFGSPGYEYVVNSQWNAGDYLTLWSIANPLSGSPKISRWTVSVPAYSLPPEAQQAGTSIPLDTGDSRLMNAVYRDGSLWTAHSKAVNWGSGTVAALAYYEIQVAMATTRQALDYGADGLYYSYPAIMVDWQGNAAIVFSRVGAGEYAGIRYTGRLRSAPANSLATSVALQAGKGSYIKSGTGAQRWGDYSGIALDPAEKTFWMLGEYAAGANSWGLWVGSAAFVFNLPNKVYLPVVAKNSFGNP